MTNLCGTCGGTQVCENEDHGPMPCPDCIGRSPGDTTTVAVEFTAWEHAELVAASGVVRTDAFVRAAALHMARTLLDTSTRRERFGGVPRFMRDGMATTGPARKETPDA